MKQFLVAAALGAGLVAGCGSSGPAAVQNPTDPAAIADPAFDTRLEVPAPPANAGTRTYTNDTFRFTISFSEADFALFTTPEYVTVLGNRIFEIVSRTLPQGQIFRPNVGMIVDSRFRGQPIDVVGYGTGGPAILSQFFQNFTVVSQTPFTISGHQAFAQEYTADWTAPNGTVVSFHRITVYTENGGDVLIFTFSAPPSVFDANRAAFQGMIDSITLF